MAQKVAVVLFNLGGPDSLQAVQPFLFNLFNDSAIIGAPGPIRWLLAQYISSKRAPVAKDIYAKIGGKSPLLDLTRQQSASLQSLLAGPAAQKGQDVRCFIAMRYWHPFTEQTVAEVKKWGAQQVILLPLYPQYSSATSGSSLKAWKSVADRMGLKVPTRSICCYPTEPGMIAAQADLLGKALQRAMAVSSNIRVLFSAHGLPKALIDRGDPYQAHVEAGAAAIVQALNQPGLDWKVTYQSRVGPTEWIGPYTDDEIKKAGAEKKGLVILPIAFVSEHSETLVELDMDYLHLAKQAGVTAYVRVPALGSHPTFIKGLAGLVGKAMASKIEPCSQSGARLCGAALSKCPNKGAA
ncbi:MAG TPA: ferrochelatase [Candidatus Sulfotelmatobacter sp.]|jgi:ferrochelatase|nr:ferrochelatase [Candidatus Sulfotelmatobacter sp.]